MPRPVSWLPRLYEIRRSVANSVRSHYGRKELEGLFELQPRAAQKLLEMLPTIAIGTSRLVPSEALADFLNRVQEAEDVSTVIEAVRQEKAQASRQRLRSLVARDEAPVSLASMPESISLQPGQLEVGFRTVEELAAAMYWLARVLESEGEEFVRAYEPVPASPTSTRELRN